MRKSRGEVDPEKEESEADTKDKHPGKLGFVKFGEGIQE